MRPAVAAGTAKRSCVANIWQIPDELWAELRAILDEQDPPRGGADHALTPEPPGRLSARAHGCAARIRRVREARRLIVPVSRRTDGW